MTASTRLVALKVWGIALLVLGVVVIAAGIFGVFNARAMWSDAEAACEGSADDMCGAGRTYAAAVLLVVSPLATLAGALMIFVGGVLVAVSRWLDRTTDKVLDAAATYLRQ